MHGEEMAPNFWSLHQEQPHFALFTLPAVREPFQPAAVPGAERVGRLLPSCSSASACTVYSKQNTVGRSLPSSALGSSQLSRRL